MTPNEFAIVHRRPDGLYQSVYEGLASPKGLYQLAICLSQFREAVPELYLVVEGHLVHSVSFSHDGMSFQGQAMTRMGDS